jgi:hypothetical protein
VEQVLLGLLGWRRPLATRLSLASIVAVNRLNPR